MHRLAEERYVLHDRGNGDEKDDKEESNMKEETLMSMKATHLICLHMWSPNQVGQSVSPPISPPLNVRIGAAKILLRAKVPRTGGWESGHGGGSEDKLELEN